MGRERRTFGLVFFDMFSENVCTYLSPESLSAVSTAGEEMKDFVSIARLAQESQKTVLTERERVDVCELCSESVPSSRQLLLVVVIVRRRQPVPKTHRTNGIVSTQSPRVRRNADHSGCTDRFPKMSSGMYMFSFSCIWIGIPRPLLYTEIVLDVRSIVILNWSIDGSLIWAPGEAQVEEVGQLEPNPFGSHSRVAARADDGLTLLSAALTRISSKILKNPGTKVTFLYSCGDKVSLSPVW